MTEKTGPVITYDTREPSDFIEKLKRLLPNFQFISATMEVGDYEVNGVVIERKSAEDYVQSMSSEHLNNQLCSMSFNYDLSYLVIIGNLRQAAFDRGVRYESIISSKFGCSFKKYPFGASGQVVTIELGTDWEFAEALKYLAVKEKIRLPKASRVSLPKKEGLVATVATVPGWGETIARQALKEFGNIQNLINSTPEEKMTRIFGCGPLKAQAFESHVKEMYVDNE